MMVYEDRPSKMIFFGVKQFFYEFGFENVRKNEFQDNNEKSCS